MSAAKPIKSLMLIAIFFSLAGLASAAYPDRPIKVIVPTNPGGGVDTMARTIARTIEEKKLLPAKMVALNLPGAGGTIGTRKVKSSPNDGYTVGIWHLGLVTSKAMKIVDYDHTAFEILGSTGYSEIGIGAGVKSKIQDYPSLKAESDKQAIKFATNIGLPVHIVPMLFADESGMNFKFVQSGGASQRLASVLGGHTDLGIFSVPEFVAYQSAGIRPIVFFTSERKSRFPEVPTALEKNIDLHINTYYIWMLPKGAPQEARNALASALKAATKEPEVIEQFRSLGMAPGFLEGEELQEKMDNIMRRLAPLIDRMRIQN